MEQGERCLFTCLCDKLNRERSARALLLRINDGTSERQNDLQVALKISKGKLIGAFEQQTAV